MGLALVEGAIVALDIEIIFLQTFWLSTRILGVPKSKTPAEEAGAAVLTSAPSVFRDGDLSNPILKYPASACQAKIIDSLGVYPNVYAVQRLARSHKKHGIR